MQKMEVAVQGMHCKSCEMLIEEELAKVPEIKKAVLSAKKGTAEIYYDQKIPSQAEIEQAVRSAGYALGADRRGWISRDSEDYKDLGFAALALFATYLVYRVLSNLGIINLNFNSASAPSDLSVVLLVGLTAGFSTCMALVGGLVLGLSARHAEKHPEASTVEKFRPHLFFNAGRVLFFALFGGLLGSLGSFFQLSPLALGLLTLAVGISMLIMGLQLVEIFPAFDRIRLTLPKAVSRFFGVKRHEGEYNHRNAIFLGALTFFLPCGFTQAMQLFAVSSGSFISGMLIMGTFALGTAPGLLGIGGLASAVKGIFAKRFFKFAGLLILLFAIFNLGNGYNLTGWQLGRAQVKPAGVQPSDPNVKIENGIQVVRMTEKSNGYTPNSFTVRKGVPVRWIVDAQDVYSCASTLVMPKLGITQRLKPGENVIEFTPNEAGTLKFSCSMGMYTGVFNVVGDSSQTISSAKADGQTAGPAGTCGASGGGSTCGGCGSCGGNRPVKANPGNVESPSGAAVDQAQVIRTTFTSNSDIQPNTFTVKSGMPVRFIVEAKEDAQGCMSAIMIPGLANDPKPIKKGQVEIDFTPLKAGTYQITCGMGVPRGTIEVK